VVRKSGKTKKKNPETVFSQQQQLTTINLIEKNVHLFLLTSCLLYLNNIMINKRNRKEENTVP